MIPGFVALASCVMLTAAQLPIQPQQMTLVPNIQPVQISTLGKSEDFMSQAAHSILRQGPGTPLQPGLLAGLPVLVSEATQSVLNQESQIVGYSYPPGFEELMRQHQQEQQQQVQTGGGQQTQQQQIQQIQPGQVPQLIYQQQNVQAQGTQQPTPQKLEEEQPILQEAQLIAVNPSLDMHFSIDGNQQSQASPGRHQPQPQQHQQIQFVSAQQAPPQILYQQQEVPQRASEIPQEKSREEQPQLQHVQFVMPPQSSPQILYHQSPPQQVQEPQRQTVGEEQPQPQLQHVQFVMSPQSSPQILYQAPPQQVREVPESSSQNLRQEQPQLQQVQFVMQSQSSPQMILHHPPQQVQNAPENPGQNPRQEQTQHQNVQFVMSQPQIFYQMSPQQLQEETPRQPQREEQPKVQQVQFVRTSQPAPQVLYHAQPQQTQAPSDKHRENVREEQPKLQQIQFVTLPQSPPAPAQQILYHVSSEQVQAAQENHRQNLKEQQQLRVIDSSSPQMFYHIRNEQPSAHPHNPQPQIKEEPSQLQLVTANAPTPQPQILYHTGYRQIPVARIQPEQTLVEQPQVLLPAAPQLIPITPADAVGSNEIAQEPVVIRQPQSISVPLLSKEMPLDAFNVVPLRAVASLKNILDSERRKYPQASQFKTRRPNSSRYSRQEASRTPIREIAQNARENEIAYMRPPPPLDHSFHRNRNEDGLILSPPPVDHSFQRDRNEDRVKLPPPRNDDLFQRNRNEDRVRSSPPRNDDFFQRNRNEDRLRLPTQIDDSFQRNRNEERQLLPPPQTDNSFQKNKNEERIQVPPPPVDDTFQRNRNEERLRVPSPPVDDFFQRNRNEDRQRLRINDFTEETREKKQPERRPTPPEPQFPSTERRPVPPRTNDESIDTSERGKEPESQMQKSSGSILSEAFAHPQGFNSAPSGYNKGGGYRERKIHKHIFVHAAPESYDGPQRPRVRVIRPPLDHEKHVNIIFVKSPTSTSPETETVVELPPRETPKTMVYVLSKKPEDKDAQVRVIAPPPMKPKAPEIYFIRYGDNRGGTRDYPVPNLQSLLENNNNNYGPPQASAPEPNLTTRFKRHRDYGIDMYAPLMAYQTTGQVNEVTEEEAAVRRSNLDAFF